MFWLLIFLFLFSHFSFAAPAVVINTISPNALLGSEFDVNFTVSNSEVGTTYYYKAFGGVGTSNADIHTMNGVNELSYTSSWSLFPFLTIGESGVFTGSLKAKAVGYPGTYNVKIRLQNSSDSEPKTIDIYPVPTPTPTNTPVPTNTPLPTNTPAPSNTPIPTNTPTSAPVPTSTPRPSATPIPTPIIEEIDTSAMLTPVIEPTMPIYETPTTSPDDTLGITDLIKPTGKVATASSFSISPTVVSTVFIVIGALLLFVPLIILKLKQ